MVDGRLYFQQHFSLPIELFSQGVDQFFHVFHDGSGMKLYFGRNDQGAVSGAMGVLYGVRFDLEYLGPQPSIQPPSITSEIFTPPTAAPVPKAQISAQPTLTLDAPKISTSPTTAPTHAVGSPVRAMPWWGWILTTLAAIVIALRLTAKK
jgi:hypothetical protein